MKQLRLVYEFHDNFLAKVYPRVFSLCCRLGKLNQGDWNLGQLISNPFS